MPTIIGKELSYNSMKKNYKIMGILLEEQLEQYNNSIHCTIYSGKR